MRALPLLLTCAAAALLASSCSTSAGVTTGTAVSTPGAGGSSAPSGSGDPGTGTAGPAPIAWDPCGDGLECGTLDVPLDYESPASGTITLFITKHVAEDPTERIGSLLVNPGGPGFGGSYLAEQADLIYSQTILDRFDIIGFDPRGTGKSTPAVDCIDDYDAYFSIDPTPETAVERRAIIANDEGFGQDCLERSGDLLSHVSTEESARDMDQIRRALGEERISYFGFSYGSELGSVWLTMFPSTVRAAVLDGAADPTADAIEGGLQQAAGFEQQLDTFLAECSANPRCAFHNDGDAAGAFDRLLSDLDEDPLEVTADRPPVNQGVAGFAVVDAMYSNASWPRLEQALADAEAGDGSGLLALYDDYLQRNPDGSWDDSYEAFIAISCLDDSGPRDLDEVDAQADRFVEVAPRLGPLFSSGYVCAVWPVPSVERVVPTGEGAGPVVVIGTTGDPATPLSSTRVMADVLEDGRLVVVEADQHTGYGVNRCVVDVVDRYLVDLVPPDDETTCR